MRHALTCLQLHHNNAGDSPTHSTPSSASAIIANVFAKDSRILDLSCRSLDSDAVVALSQALRASHSILEVDLQCTVVDARGAQILFQSIRDNPIIRTVRLDGASIPLHWKEAIEAQCRENRQIIAEQEERNLSRSISYFKQQAQEAFDRAAPLLLRDAVNGSLAIEHEEQVELLMIRRAYGFISIIAQETTDRRAAMNNLLLGARLIVGVESEQRVSFAAEEMSCKLDAVTQFEATLRGDVQLWEEQSMKKIVHESREGYLNSRRETQCRLTKEEFERSDAELREMEERVSVSKEERGLRGALACECDSLMARLMAAWSEQKQHDEEERRRARIRGDEEARERTFRIERQRQEFLLTQQKHKANRLKHCQAETTARTRILAAEKTLFALLQTLASQVLEVNLQEARLQHALDCLQAVIDRRPCLELQTRYSSDNPIFAFEHSFAWRNLDSDMHVVFEMDPSWASDVDQRRSDCKQAAMAAQTLRLSRQKQIRASWDSIATGSKKIGILYDFCAQGLGEWMPQLFGAGIKDEVERLNFCPIADLLDQKLRIRKGRLEVVLEDDDGPLHMVVPSEKYQEEMRILWNVASDVRLIAGTSIQCEIPPDCALHTIHCALRTVAYRVGAEHFGTLRRWVTMRLECNEATAVQRLPLCVCERFFESERVEAKAKGPEEVLLGYPWTLRDLPVSVPRSNGSDSRDLFPEVDFSGCAVCSTTGFAGASLSVEIERGAAATDRVFLDLQSTSFLEGLPALNLGLLMIKNQIIGRVVEGSFDKQADDKTSPPSKRQVLQFESTKAITKEVVLHVINGLRFTAATKDPATGTREVAVRISPPFGMGPKVVLSVAVDAVDEPTQMELPERHPVLRARCRPETPASLCDLAFLPSVVVAKNALVVDPDTTKFSGGYLKVWIQHGTARWGDHLWVANSDGRGSLPAEALRPGIYVLPAETCGDSCRSPRQLANSSGQPPGEDDAKVDESEGILAGRVCYEDRCIGELRYKPFTPTDFTDTTDIGDVAQLALRKGPSLTENKLRKAAKMARRGEMGGTLGVKWLSVIFSRDGTATIAAAQELLRNVRFSSAKAVASAGTRDVFVELLIGQTEGRVDATGKAISVECENEVLRDRVSVRVTPALIRNSGRSFEVCYNEGGDPKRLSADILGEDESFTPDFAPPGFVRFDIAENASAFDRVRLDSSDQGSNAAKFSLVSAPEEVPQLLEQLNSVYADYLLREPLRPQPDGALLPAECESPRASAPLAQGMSFRGTAGVPLAPSSSLSLSLNKSVNSASGDYTSGQPVAARHLPFAAANPWDCVVPVTSMSRSTKMCVTSHSLFDRGIDWRYRDVEERGFAAWHITREGDHVATAAAVPGVCTIWWHEVLSRKDLLGLMRLFSYDNIDPSPKDLQKVGRITLFDGNSHSCAMFSIIIIPQNEPLQVCLLNTAIKYRFNATEKVRPLGPAAVVSALKSYRQQYCSNNLPIREGEFAIGAVRLFPSDELTLRNPATELWDNGAIVVDVVSGGSGSESVGLLTVDLQLLQWEKRGSAPEMLLHTYDDKGCFELTDGDLMPKLAQMGEAVPLPKPNGPTGLQINFFGRLKAAAAHGVTVPVLQYVLSCISYTFGNGTAPPSLGTRVIRATIFDGRSPTPAKAQVTVEVVPPFFATKDLSCRIQTQVTRTKSPVDAYQLFQKVAVPLPEREACPLGYLECFIASAPLPDDLFALRFNGTSFTMHDNQLFYNKDLVGGIVITDHYLRLDLAGKGVNGKKLLELIRSIFVTYTNTGDRKYLLTMVETPRAATVATARDSSSHSTVVGSSSPPPTGRTASVSSTSDKVALDVQNVEVSVVVHDFSVQ